MRKRSSMRGTARPNRRVRDPGRSTRHSLRGVEIRARDADTPEVRRIAPSSSVVALTAPLVPFGPPPPVPSRSPALPTAPRRRPTATGTPDVSAPARRSEVVDLRRERRVRPSRSTPTSAPACTTAVRSASRSRRFPAPSRRSRSRSTTTTRAIPGPYPIPRERADRGWAASSSGDRHVLVVDRDRCRLYEMYSVVPAERRGELDRRVGRGVGPHVERVPSGQVDVGRRGRSADPPGSRPLRRDRGRRDRPRDPHHAQRTDNRYVWPATHRAGVDDAERARRWGSGSASRPASTSRPTRRRPASCWRP